MSITTEPQPQTGDVVKKIEAGQAQPSTPPPATPPAAAAKPRKWILPLALLLIAAGVAYLMHRTLSAPTMLADGLIQASGRVEGDTISVSSKFAGRIGEAIAREGDQVAKGQVLARIDDEQVRARLDEARSALAAAESQLNAARTSLGTARKEVPLSVEVAGAALEHARAQERKAEASESQAYRDAQRFARLSDKGSVGSQRSEQAQLAWVSARSDHEAATSGIDQAQQQWKLAQLGWEHTVASESQVHGLESQVSQARAAVADAASVLENMTIRAPIDGVVTTKIRDVGEVIAPGAPLYEIVNLDRLYLKVYVPEPLIGKLRLGLPAQIYTDAYPSQSFDAKVSYISDHAEFTPKEVQTPDERVKLVFAVKLELNANPQHHLMPGMPADAVIRWQEGTPWSKPIR